MDILIEVFTERPATNWALELGFPTSEITILPPRRASTLRRCGEASRMCWAVSNSCNSNRAVNELAAVTSGSSLAWLASLIACPNQTCWTWCSRHRRPRRILSTAKLLVCPVHRCPSGCCKLHSGWGPTSHPHRALRMHPGQNPDRPRGWLCENVQQQADPLPVALGLSTPCKRPTDRDPRGRNCFRRSQPHLQAQLASCSSPGTDRLAALEPFQLWELESAISPFLLLSPCPAEASRRHT